MPNTLTNLIPELYTALDVVSRELVGMIPSVTLDPIAQRAAVGQTVRSFVAPAAAASDITPGVVPPNDGDQVIGNVPIVISKSRRVPLRWTGEEELGVSSGSTASAIRQNQIQQAIRTLCNEIETDLCMLHIRASRAIGTAGTTPFGTAGDYTAASLARKILVDNGAPQTDLQLVIDTAAGANLRGRQSTAQHMGTTEMLRQGVLLDINGMAVRESAQVVNFTAGSFSSGTLAALVRPIGTTVLTTTADYSGGLGAGDVITLAHEGNAHAYVIASVSATAITINAPGIRTATPNATVAITKVGNSRRNMAFHRGAIVLAQRLPALPEGGDLAVDRTTITDPRSGLSFEVAMYPQYRMMQYEVSCAWGVACVKPEHVALLLG